MSIQNINRPMLNKCCLSWLKFGIYTMYGLVRLTIRPDFPGHALILGLSCGGASLIQAWFKLAPPLYKNSNKFKINYTKILGFSGLWKSPKTNFPKPPLFPKKQPSFWKISPSEIKGYQNFGLFLGYSKMSISIFGLQPLIPIRTPAWPYSGNFHQKSSFCKLYCLGRLCDFWALRKCINKFLGSNA